MKSEIGSPTTLAAAGDTTTNGAEAAVGTTTAPAPTTAAGRTTDAELPVSRRATAAADHAKASETPPLREPNHESIDGDMTGTVGGATTSVFGGATSAASVATSSGATTPSGPCFAFTREFSRAPIVSSAVPSADPASARDDPAPGAASPAPLDSLVPPERPPRPPGRVDEVDDDAVPLPADGSLDTAAEPSDPDESAKAIGIAVNADPTPRATARAPTRPTYAAGLVVRRALPTPTPLSE